MARTELKPLGKPSTVAASTEAAPAPRKLGENKPSPKAGLKPLTPKPAPAPEVVEVEVVEETPVTTETVAVEATPEPTPAPVAKQEIVVREEAPLVFTPAAAPAFELGRVTGPIEQSDIYRPRLELSQSVGPLMEAGFTPGQIVLASEYPIWAEGYDPIKVTVIASRKQFVENVEFGGDKKQRIFNSPLEVKDAGLWTEWLNDEAPPVYPRLTCVALIEKPDFVEETEAFGIELVGKLYAIAEIRWDGAAYSRAAKTIMTAAGGLLAKGLHRGCWNYSCKREKLKVNTVTVPVIKFAGFHSEEFVNAVSDLAW